jgi:hypothetical protein
MRFWTGSELCSQTSSLTWLSSFVTAGLKSAPLRHFDNILGIIYANSTSKFMQVLQYLKLTVRHIQVVHKRN